ncbi:alpha-N-acetylgalactosaminide alpha-2,6-sialyltransferase 2-like isoform X3 [Anneissia japonica]|uniref:alpha-N-acetylgalactosaminide alpha-2,6-sialyltransferase 2-like isoform X3 n=1 Tax=Anneissia japonica TaxID=1529436 RepID=UPI0014257CDB|nr:alpha-N-acetylgalactosaminide alpha-2,6-sialyltransferase 2-like isoform X3 [Anneissia japonica]
MAGSEPSKGLLSFARFANGTINNFNRIVDSTFKYRDPQRKEYTQPKVDSGIRAFAQNLTVLPTTASSLPTEESIPDFVPKFLVKKEPDENDEYASEKVYYHDNQYLQYLKCPTSVRRKMMTMPEMQSKYIVDIPVLMWSKHFSNSEFQRLNKFRGINGFDDVDTDDVRGTLDALSSPNNQYMFDKRMTNGKPNGGCITCAVIGNGGILNGSRKGQEIDAHDYVFRVNTALTTGFEEDVGRRTSFYCFTMITLSNTLRGSRQFGFRSPPYYEDIRYLFFADSGWTYEYLNAVLHNKPAPFSRGKYHRGPPQFPKGINKENIKVIHPDFERYLKWSWVNSKHQHKNVHRPTTGAIMLLAALHTCDQVDIYGFGGSYDKFSEHYYDKKFQKHIFFANHDNIAENNLWEQLHKLGIVKMYKRD